MIIIKPNAELWIPQSREQHIARCASICYGSKGFRTPNENKDLQLVNTILKSNHLSVFRHSSLYYIIPMYEIVNDKQLGDYINSLLYSPYVNIRFIAESCYISTNEQWAMDNKEIAGKLYKFAVNEKVFVESDNTGISSYIRRITFCITTQISTSRELNRVSPNNISEESTRFCNYSKDKFTNDITIVQPYWLDLFRSSNDTYIKYDGKTFISETLDNVPLDDFNINYCIMDDRITPKTARTFIGHAYKETTYYLQALKHGLVPQEARELLPMLTATTIVYTYTVEEWIKILLLRYYGVTGKPHPNAKIIATLIAKHLISLGYNIDKIANIYCVKLYNKNIEELINEH